MFGFLKNTAPKTNYQNNTDHSHDHDNSIPGIEKTYMATVVGPGYWSSIHKIAAEAKDERTKAFFVNHMNFIRNNFPCSECKTHINEYMTANPIQPYLRQPDGCFLWAWKFHNTVNRRLGKREVPIEEANKIYKKQEGVCSLNCASSNNSVPKPVILTSTPKPTPVTSVINNPSPTPLSFHLVNENQRAKQFDQSLDYVIKHNFRYSK